MMTEPMGMNNREHRDEWEVTVKALAEAYPFPPAPAIAGRVRQRLEAKRALPRRPARPAWQRPALAFAVLLLLLALALSVPAVRAAVLEWLQIGAVRIVVTPPVAPATLPATEIAPTPLPFGEQVTLDEARAQAGFELRLPTAAPADRPPDQVLFQSFPDLPGTSAVIFVWFDPAQPGTPQLSLYQIQGAPYATKMAHEVAIAETIVGGDPAFWVEGPHPLVWGNGESWSIVTGDVLVWTDGAFTYRLESTLSLEETERVADSIQ